MKPQPTWIFNDSPICTVECEMYDDCNGSCNNICTPAIEIIQEERKWLIEMVNELRKLVKDLGICYKQRVKQVADLRRDLDRWRKLANSFESERNIARHDLAKALADVESYRQNSGPFVTSDYWYKVTCTRCGHTARDHVVDDEERRECTKCDCKQYIHEE